MGREIVYCDLCGERLLETEFVEGKAVTVFNKNYCINCKDEALKDVDPEDIPQVSSPPREATPSPRRSYEALGEESPPRPSRSRMPAATRSPARQAKRPSTPRGGTGGGGGGSKMPIIIGGAIGVIAVILLVAVAAGGGGSDDGSTDNNNSSNGSNTSNNNSGNGSSNSGTNNNNPNSGDNREDRARQAFEDCEQHWSQNKNDPDGALKYLENKKGAMAGTAYWGRYIELKQTIQTVKDSAKYVQIVRDRIAEAERLIKADSDFSNFMKVREILSDARGLARRHKVEHLMTEILNIEKPYTEKYEAEAKVEYDKRYQIISTYARDKEYKAAIKMIDSFPGKYRSSTWWKYLEDLKRDYERRIGG